MSKEEVLTRVLKWRDHENQNNSGLQSFSSFWPGRHLFSQQEILQKKLKPIGKVESSYFFLRRWLSATMLCGKQSSILTMVPSSWWRGRNRWSCRRRERIRCGVRRRISRIVRRRDRRGRWGQPWDPPWYNFNQSICSESEEKRECAAGQNSRRL